MQDILRLHAYHPRDCFADTPVTSFPLHNDQTGSRESLAAIWITNAEKSRRAAYEALLGTGFDICEEWIWIKTTAGGQPVSLLEALWRKPYEILVIGRKKQTSTDNRSESDLLGIDPASIHRRVIAAVPDLHSRKPNLKVVFERLFFASNSYSALEVFARNLTAGWWACGNEVLKFNSHDCWTKSGNEDHASYVYVDSDDSFRW